MGRKRDTDRLGHVVLKYNAVEVARIINGYKSDVAKETCDECKLAVAKDALEEMLATMKTIGAIMSKAESAKSFAFSDKDSGDMSIADICKDMDIDIESFGSKSTEDVEAIIDEAVVDIAKKMGLKAEDIVVG